MPFPNLPAELKKTIPWTMVVIFILLTTGLIMAGRLFYTSQRSRIYKEQEEALSAIASLKIGQIEQWHSERLGDAAIIKDNEPFIRMIRQYFRGENHSELIEEMKNWMISFNNTDNYRSIMLLDTAFKIRFSFSTTDSLPSGFDPEELNEIKMSHKIIMTDICNEAGVNYIHIDILIPLNDTKGNKITLAGFVILRIDPWKKLFPLIQTWPTPSKSSETLLLKRDGDSVLFLNELRHQKNTALNLRLPVSNDNLLASKAVRGINGIVEGVDYRNVPVVGYVASLPGLPWFMVAKTDKDELSVPVRRILYNSVVTTILLILISGSVFGFWIWNQRVRFYRLQLKNEIDRKKVEEDLLESEERFSLAYKTSPISFLIANMEDGKIIEVNDAFTAISGFTREEAFASTTLNMNIWVHEEDRQNMIAILRDGGTVIRKETMLRSKNGKIITALLSAQVIQLAHKYCIISSIEDITERKKAEEALRESEDKFKYVFDNSVIGKSITFPNGEINVNKAFCEMLGYNREELEKTKWQDISHPDDIESNNKAIALITSGAKEFVRFNKRYIHKNGSIVWTDASTSLRRDNDGNPLYFMTTVIDITERRHNELERTRLLQILESSLDEIYVFNSESLFFEYVNQGALNNLGYTMVEMKSMTPLDLKPEFTDVSFRAAIKPLLDHQKKTILFETIHRRADGSLYPVEVHLQLVELEDQQVFLAVIIDITLRKFAETQIRKLNEELEERVVQRTEQLEALNKELEAFSYSVSHDLRAPLRAVHSYTNILLEEYENKLDEEGKRICNIISSSATQMGGLIDDLLSFSRIGRSSLNPGMLNMKSIVESVFDEIAGENGREKIKFKIGRLHKAFVDSNLIRLVWNNLISNAIKYSSKETEPEILISSKQEGDKIIYSVNDNGVGFDMQYVHKLFGVFQRLHSESEFEGNGVGLAIVQRIILRHGGQVWAEGEVDYGATFYFSLSAKGGE